MVGETDIPVVDIPNFHLVNQFQKIFSEEEFYKSEIYRRVEVVINGFNSWWRLEVFQIRDCRDMLLIFKFYGISMDSVVKGRG
ncbi:MAG: hypothetical protein ACP5QK_01750 [Myxococcota bacterium]